MMSFEFLDENQDSARFEMLEIFKECQINTLSHERLCVQLKRLYDKVITYNFVSC